MKYVATVLILLLIVNQATAQNALLRAQERAAYLQSYKALLLHEDESVRMAAVEEALNGNDAQLRSMALESAMGSDDERLQTTAIRWYVNARSQLLVTFLLPERPSQAQEYIYQNWNGLILKNPEVVEPGDEINFKARMSQGGQLIRGGMQFRFGNPQRGTCTMTVKAATGTLLAGQFHCTFSRTAKQAGATEAAIPVRIDLS